MLITRPLKTTIKTDQLQQNNLLYLVSRSNTNVIHTLESKTKSWRNPQRSWCRFPLHPTGWWCHCKRARKPSKNKNCTFNFIDCTEQYMRRFVSLSHKRATYCPFFMKLRSKDTLQFNRGQVDVSHRCYQMFHTSVTGVRRHQFCSIALHSWKKAFFSCTVKDKG